MCGVGAGPRTALHMALRHRNLHLPLAYAPDGEVDATTYNGYRCRARHARLVEVPPLPAGWRGLPDEHVRCRNYRFAVACFGPPRASAELAARRGAAAGR